jgi:hypothetical protein
MNARGLHFLLGQRQTRIGGRQEVTHCVSLQTALNLDPFMIHETFLCLTETAFGSHPCRIVSFTAVTRVQIPSGTPNLFRYLQLGVEFL